MLLLQQWEHHTTKAIKQIVFPILQISSSGCLLPFCDNCFPFRLPFTQFIIISTKLYMYVCVGTMCTCVYVR